MKQLVSKIKPSKGFAGVLHTALNVLLPILIYVFVRLSLPQIALVLVLLSKWRIFAVKPRYWIPNLQANAVDLFVGISTVIFVTHSASQVWQMIWVILYAGWLIAIKPRSGTLWVSLQATIGQLFGLSALFVAFGAESTLWLTLGAWAVCYLAARHFFSAFDEPYTRLLSLTWGYFAAAMTWVLGHWLLYYGVVAQPVVLMSVIGYTLATLYYLDHQDKLSVFLRRQFIFIMIAIIVIVLTFSNWTDAA